MTLTSLGFDCLFGLIWLWILTPKCDIGTGSAISLGGGGRLSTEKNRKMMMLKMTVKLNNCHLLCNLVKSKRPPIMYWINWFFSLSSLRLLNYDSYLKLPLPRPFSPSFEVWNSGGSPWSLATPIKSNLIADSFDLGWPFRKMTIHLGKDWKKISLGHMRVCRIEI